MLSYSEQLLTQIQVIEADTEGFIALSEAIATQSFTLIYQRHVTALLGIFPIKKSYMQEMPLPSFHLHGTATHEAF